MTDAEKKRLRDEVTARRQSLIAELERERGSRVITLIHRREPWADERDDTAITIEDTKSVLRTIRDTPGTQPIDVVLHTPGGLALAAEMIAIALKAHPSRVTVMVPFYAMSGGTLIALAAEEILMERYSVLGPVDPQIGGLPAAALLALIQTKPPQTIQDVTWVQAFIATQAQAQVKRFVASLLAGKMSDEKVVNTANFLTAGYVTHDTPITLETAQALGLKAVEGVPNKVYALFETCAFGECARPAVAVYR